jgi:hypothetical protein
MEVQVAVLWVLTRCSMADRNISAKHAASILGAEYFLIFYHEAKTTGKRKKNSGNIGKLFPWKDGNCFRDYKTP